MNSVNKEDDLLINSRGFNESPPPDTMSNDQHLVEDLTADETTAHNHNRSPPIQTNHNTQLSGEDTDEVYWHNESNNSNISQRSRNNNDYGVQISNLKNENFSLKLRIYYMEDRMQNNLGQEELVKKNIELNVECERLKKDLLEKHELLIKASNAVKLMEINKCEEVKLAKRKTAEIEELKKRLDEKMASSDQNIHMLQKAAEDAAKKSLKYKAELENEKDKMESLLTEIKDLKESRRKMNFGDEDNFDTFKECNEYLKKKMNDLQEDLEDKDSTISRLKECLSSKQTVIELLNEEKRKSCTNQQSSTLNNDMKMLQDQLEEKILEIKECKLMESQARKDYVEHITEQQQRLDDFELATKQMTEELDRRENDLKEIKKQFKTAKDEYEEEIERLKEERDESEDEIKREVNKRDKAIAVLTKVLRSKEDEVEKLQEEIRNFEEKAEDLADTLHKFEMQKPQMASKDKVISQLRAQLHESDQALQEMLDEKMRIQTTYEKETRQLKLQARSFERQNERCKAELDRSEEATLRLDAMIKEKDEDLQTALNKSKLISRDLQAKDDECNRLARERDDLSDQLSVEKRRFGELADKLLAQQSRDGSVATDDTLSVSATQRVWELEDKLRAKGCELDESCRDRDKTLLEVTSLKREIERLIQQREQEIAEKRDDIARKDNKIVTLTSSLEKSNALRREAEEKLMSETEEFKRLNEQLHDKWMNSKSEVEKLRADRLRSSTDDSESLRLEVRQLYEELEAREKEIETLHNTQSRPVYILEEEFSDATNDYDGELVASKRSYDLAPHEGLGQTGDQITYSYNVINQSQTQSQMQGGGERLQLMSSSSVNENKHVRMHEDIKQVQSSVDEINRTLTTRNETVNTTFGNVLDQTSYLQIQPQVHLANEDSDFLDLGINELRKVLHDTRNQLKESLQGFTEISKVSNQQTQQIQDLKEQLSIVTVEKNKLKTQEEENIKNKMSLEDEVTGLLQRLHDVEQRCSEQDIQIQEETASKQSSKSRRRSGEDSDGMSSLSRKELNSIVSNLKKKLRNAEKLNSLLKVQIDKSEAKRLDAESNSAKSEDEKLITDLANQVERLKDELHEAELREIESSHVDLSSSSPPLRTSQSSSDKILSSSDRADLNRALKINKKLRSRLSATESTVRQQAEKLNQCRSSSRETGVSSPPLKRMKSYKSVPNLLDEDSKLSARKRFQTEASTQTSFDSGFSSQTSLNLVISQQSKDLSSLKSRLEKSRTACKQLNSQMDVLSNYIQSLVTSGADSFDPFTVDDVTNELARSRRMVELVRRSLGSNSEEDDDPMDSGESCITLNSDVPSPSLARIHNLQIARLTNQLADRNQMISKLRHNDMTSQPPKLDRVHNRVSLNASKTRSSFDHRGVLTPSSSFNSLITDEEIAALRDPESSECSLPYSGNLNRRSRSISHLNPSGRISSDLSMVKISTDFNGAWKSADPSPRRARQSLFQPLKDVESSCEDLIKVRSLHQYERAIERLRRRLVDSRKLHKSTKDELDIVTISLYKAREEIENLKKGSQQSRDDAGNSCSQLDSLISHLDEIRTLRHRLETSIDNNDQLRDKLEASILATKADESGKQVDEDEVRSLQIQLMKSKEDHLLKLKSSETEICKLKNEVAVCRSHLREAESNEFQLRRDLESLEELNRQMTRSLEKAETELKKQNSVSVNLSKEVEMKNEKLKKLEAEKKDINFELDCARKISSRLEKEIVNYRSKNLESDQLITTLKSQLHLIEKLEDQIRQLEVRSDRMQNLQMKRSVSSLAHNSPRKSKPSLRLDLSRTSGGADLSRSLITPPTSASIAPHNDFFRSSFRSVDDVTYHAEGPYRVCRKSSFEKLNKFIDDCKKMCRDIDDDVTHKLRATSQGSAFSSFLRIVSCIENHLTSSSHILINDFWSAISSTSDPQRSISPHLYDSPEDAHLQKEIFDLKDQLSHLHSFLQSVLTHIQDQNRFKAEIGNAIEQKLLKKQSRDQLQKNMSLKSTRNKSKR